MEESIWSEGDRSLDRRSDFGVILGCLIVGVLAVLCYWLVPYTNRMSAQDASMVFDATLAEIGVDRDCFEAPVIGERSEYRWPTWLSCSIKEGKEGEVISALHDLKIRCLTYEHHHMDSMLPYPEDPRWWAPSDSKNIEAIFCDIAPARNPMHHQYEIIVATDLRMIFIKFN